MDDDFSIYEALRVLAARPECIHGLNGPCKACGPSLSLDEACDWLTELEDLGVD